MPLEVIVGSVALVALVVTSVIGTLSVTTSDRGEKKLLSEIFRLCVVTTTICFMVVVILALLFPPIQREEEKIIETFDAELCEEFGIKNTEHGFVFSYYGEDGEIVSVATKELDIEDILFLRKTTVVVEKLEVIHIEDWRVFRWKAEREKVVRYKILRPVEGVKKR